MSKKIVYKDSLVTIYEFGAEEKKNFILWTARNQPENKSYMTAKLAEYVGTYYPGAWVVGEHDEVLPGVKCFYMKWIGKKLIARWHKNG